MEGCRYALTRYEALLRDIVNMLKKDTYDLKTIEELILQAGLWRRIIENKLKFSEVYYKKVKNIDYTYLPYIELLILNTEAYKIFNDSLGKFI
ncbi:MAG: hypothetical protein GXO04_05875 [Aquificae bacterium]|nr:hypothetical protein [Aquificota bacterium]